jgi:hypothetical protein
MYIGESFRLAEASGKQQFERLSGQIPVNPHTSNLVSKERFRYPLKAVFLPILLAALARSA